MMHQKKIAKLKHKIFYKPKERFIKHSIPIINNYNAKKKNLSLHHNFSKLSYSIPLLSMFALLLIGDISVISVSNTDNINKAYAQENDNLDNEDYSIDLQNTTAGLTIANPNLVSNEIAPGEVGYISSNVTYVANDISSYTLRLTYANGYDSLKLDHGTATLAGANGKKPTGTDSMADNSWGFAWSDTSANDEELTYYTVPAYNTTGTNINTGLLENVTAGSINATKKLTFAAKFANSGVTKGHYKTSVLLSLAATPKMVTYSVSYNANAGADTVTNLPSNYSDESMDDTKIYTIPDNTPARAGYTFLGYSTNPSATEADENYAPGKSVMLSKENSMIALNVIWKKAAPTWDNITTMQDMTAETCANAPERVSKTIVDTRNDKSYSIMKFEDGKCWMTSNLTIANATLTPDKSDVLNSDYSIPATTTSSWNYNNALADYVGVTDGQYYYTWCSATAGTCVNSGQAVSSVCPKGWHLPSGAEYTQLVNAAGITFSNIKQAPYSFGPGGNYWTSTAYDSQQANLFYFGAMVWSSAPNTNSNMYLAIATPNKSKAVLTVAGEVYVKYSNRGNGAHVRCVANDQ